MAGSDGTWFESCQLTSQVSYPCTVSTANITPHNLGSLSALTCESSASYRHGAYNSWTIVWICNHSLIN